MLEIDFNEETVIKSLIYEIIVILTQISIAEVWEYVTFWIYCEGRGEKIKW